MRKRAGDTAECRAGQHRDRDSDTIGIWIGIVLVEWASMIFSFLLRLTSLFWGKKSNIIGYNRIE